MPVYVDDAYIPFGRMKMCHMIADTEEELHGMAAKIGLKREWFQDTSRPHYDVGVGKRHLATRYGAIPITVRELVMKMIKGELKMETGAGLITAERKRHVDEEGWTPEHDDEHSSGSMVEAAVCYSLYGEGELAHIVPDCWPWDEIWWKPSTYKRNLVKAGALIAAELDRVLRSGVDGRGEPSFRDFVERGAPR